MSFIHNYFSMDAMMTLSKQELKELTEALHYMNMAELKNLNKHYQLPTKGNKVALIHRIITFITTGKIVAPKVIPTISKAQKSKTYPLAKNTFMLYGSYKNDAETRAFLKKIIGNHFHFTAFGIDWLNERWMAGKPPTYEEFARFWQEETNRRNHEKVSPKREWAYINFTQRFVAKYPTASKNEIMKAWKKERLLNVERVKKLLKPIAHSITKRFSLRKLSFAMIMHMMAIHPQF